MRITIEGDVSRIDEFLSSGLSFERDGILKCGDFNFLLVLDEMSWDIEGVCKEHIVLELMELAKKKTLEELTVEEAVSKAKENLMAAEETLKKIKDKDND